MTIEFPGDVTIATPSIPQFLPPPNDGGVLILPMGGPAGPSGPQGVPGPQGTPGTSTTVTALTALVEAEIDEYDEEGPSLVLLYENAKV